MSIDFTQLENEDCFEMLCRDVLESLGHTILEHPSKGPDRKKDLKISVEQDDKLGGRRQEVFLVQCKHKAVSGKSVLESELGDIRSTCKTHDVDGYLLITSTSLSVSVASNLKAINDDGSYLTKSWDRKQLEEQIESSPKKQRILERYGLKDSLEASFTWMKRILDAGEIPWELVGEINEPNLRGRIYSHETADLKIIKSAFCCVDGLLDESWMKEIKSSHSLEDVFAYSLVGHDQINHSHDEFLQRVNFFRDYWYQDKLCFLANWLQPNPALIHMINDIIAVLPYERFQPLLDILKAILRGRKQGHDLMLIAVTSQAAAKLRMLDMREDIFKWIESVVYDQVQIANPRKYMAAYTQYLISAMVSLDEADSAYAVKLSQLWEHGDLQFKCDLLQYYEKLSLSLMKDKASELLLTDGQTSIFPRNHGIFFTRPVHFVYNSSPETVSKVVERYLDVL